MSWRKIEAPPKISSNSQVFSEYLHDSFRFKWSSWKKSIQFIKCHVPCSTIFFPHLVHPDTACRACSMSYPPPPSPSTLPETQPSGIEQILLKIFREGGWGVEGWVWVGNAFFAEIKSFLMFSFNPLAVSFLKYSQYIIHQPNAYLFTQN